MNHRTQYIAFVLFCLLAGTVQAKKWGVKNAPLLTPWSENIDPQNVLPEYPRPMMVRDEWRNLNGIWEFQQGFEGDKVPFNKRLSDEILVPFPWEGYGNNSPLSGDGTEKRLRYLKTGADNGCFFISELSIGRLRSTSTGTVWGSIREVSMRLVSI